MSIFDAANGPDRGKLNRYNLSNTNDWLIPFTLKQCNKMLFSLVRLPLGWPQGTGESIVTGKSIMQLSDQPRVR